MIRLHFDFYKGQMINGQGLTGAILYFKGPKQIHIIRLQIQCLKRSRIYGDFQKRQVANGPGSNRGRAPPPDDGQVYGLSDEVSADEETRMDFNYLYSNLSR